MEVEKNEEIIKAGLAIIFRASIESPQIGRQRLGAEILDELTKIRAMQQKMIYFMEY